MPRIDYDDDRDDDDRDGSRWTGWRRRLVTWTLAAAGLGLGFLIPYTIYLNHQVSERFGELRWQLPTRVYARPLELVPGLAMDAQTLKTELDAAAYRDDGAGVRPGTYLRDGGRWLIASRGCAGWPCRGGTGRARDRNGSARRPATSACGRNSC